MFLLLLIVLLACPIKGCSTPEPTCNNQPQGDWLPWLLGRDIGAVLVVTFMQPHCPQQMPTVYALTHSAVCTLVGSEDAL